MDDERVAFHSDRPDGRFVHCEGFLHAYLSALEPALAFDPAASADGLAVWREQVAGKLRELLHFPRDIPPQPPPRMLWAEPRDGYELQKWEAYPEPFSVVPFLVLIPDGVTPTAPGAAVMCVPGSNGTKEVLADEPQSAPWPVSPKHPERNRMAWHYAKAGLIAVAVDHPDRGERTNYMFKADRYPFSVHAIWTGRSFEGISVFEKRVILDWLKQQSWVDATRIAVCGHSLGAKPALHLAVIDPSIAALVWNDFTSHWLRRELMIPTFRPHLGHYIPGMQEWFDYLDLMSAVAPRPMLITEGGRTRDLERVRQAWASCGAEDNFSVSYYPKYATPDKRQHDDQDLFQGMTMDEYFEYANVDVPQHCFKENVAVPWLTRVLGVD